MLWIDVPKMNPNGVKWTCFILSKSICKNNHWILLAFQTIPSIEHIISWSNTEQNSFECEKTHLVFSVQVCSDLISAAGGVCPADPLFSCPPASPPSSPEWGQHWLKEVLISCSQGDMHTDTTPRVTTLGWPHLSNASCLKICHSSQNLPTRKRGPSSLGRSPAAHSGYEEAPQPAREWWSHRPRVQKQSPWAHSPPGWRCSASC